MAGIRRWIEEARRGDREAFAKAFQALSGPLRGVIRRGMGPAIRQRVDAEDVLQDTFVRALHSLERFQWRGEDSFRTWLESIAPRVTLDVVRRHGRRKTLCLDGEPTGNGASPSKGIARRERLDRLESALQSLSPDHRTVLMLCRMEGLSMKDISVRMNRSESAVKNLLLRATRQLRLSFGETESLNLGSGRLGGQGVSDGR